MAMDVEKELKELRRRVDLAETRLSQLEGRFEFVSGQLRDIQLYMHSRFDEIDARFDAGDARFDAIDARFDAVDARFDAMDAKIDAKIDGLRADMPDIVAKAVGSVLRKGD
jgi:tetrahydromethanopterin S-methyltransferase subunit G